MMNRISIAVLAAVAALAVRADGQSAEQEDRSSDSPAARLERCRRLVERYQPSTARVLYTLKLDEDGEPPQMAIYYMCPNCSSRHRRDVDYYFERNIPFEALGYVVGPDKVLMQDVRVLPKWTKSIEVEFNGVKYSAKETLRYPLEGGVLIETDKPIEGAKPLEFKGGGIPEKPEYFYVVRENGLTVSGIKGSKAASFKHYAEAGRDFYEGAPNTIVVDENGEAVTVALQPMVELGKEQFAPPSEWKSVPASSFADEVASIEKMASGFSVPLYIRLESQSKDSGRYSRSGGDEMYAPGLALANGEVLVPANMSAEDTARLNSIEYAAKDGKKTKLEFVGSLDEWGAFVARFPDGRLPEGFSPARFSDAKPPQLLCSTVFAVKAETYSGKLKVKARKDVIDGFELTWGGAVVPVVGMDSGGEGLSAALTGDGSVIAIPLPRRQPSSRWSSRNRTFTLRGTDVADLVSSRSFNPEFVPRSEADRNRVAWIGVDVVNLTAEVAREKKITEFLKDDSGALVTKVYPGTPAAKAGIKDGDVLLSVRAEKSQKAIPLSAERDYGSSFSIDLDGEIGSLFSSMGGGSLPWPNAEEGVNSVLSRLGIGARVVVAWVSDRTRREAPMVLEQIPVHYANARRSRNRDIGMTVCDMTYEVRSYFRLDDDAPGVVISKLKPGDPAAVAGLRRYEIITDVNGKPVRSAKEFGAAVKGQKELTFSVRQLTATRIVRIALSDVKGDEPRK